MTAYAYSDAACNQLGCAWGGAVLGPNNHLTLACGLLVRACSGILELQAAVRVLTRASELCAGERVVLHCDNRAAVRQLQQSLARPDRSISVVLAAARRRCDPQVEWLPRERPEIELCDALADLAVAGTLTSLRTRRTARERVLQQLGRTVYGAGASVGAPAPQVAQAASRALHRLRPAGSRWQWTDDLAPAGRVTIGRREEMGLPTARRSRNRT